MNKKIIYVDHAATTMLSRMFDEMRPYFTEYYGNPFNILLAERAKP